MSNHGFPDDLTILSQPETWAPLKKICIMATTNNNMRVVAKKMRVVADNMGDGLCWCRNALVSLGKWIIGVILLVMLLVFVFNPVMFLFWSVLVPKGTAKLLYGEDLGLYSKLVQNLNGWMIALYPFFMKKYFMEIRGICNYSAKAQCQYYRKTGRRVSVIKEMSNDAVQMLWESGFDEREKIVACGLQLSDDQFAFLVNNGPKNTAIAYISQYTPNENKLRHLIKNEAYDVLIPAIKIYGLPEKLISLLFAEGKSETIAAVQEALVAYSHRQIVLHTQRCDMSGGKEWKTFCNDVERGKIRSNAQKAMDRWQYTVFHEAGHALDKEAVEFFFERGDVSMCRLIFAYEQNNGRVSEKAKALIAANPKLTTTLLQVVSEAKKV